MSKRVKQIHGRMSYPFNEMGVNDSFVFDDLYEHNIRAAASSFAKRHGVVFVVNKTKNNKVRCKRVE